MKTTTTQNHTSAATSINAAKLPKEAVDAYIKLEENKIYWVGKKGEEGSIEIW